MLLEVHELTHTVPTAIAVLLTILGTALGAAIGYIFFVRIVKKQESAQTASLLEAQNKEAVRLRESLQKDADEIRRKSQLDAREEALRLRAEVEEENRAKRAEIQRLERRLAQREESLDKRADSISSQEEQIRKSEAFVEKQQMAVELLQKRRLEELQRISGLGIDEAKSLFLKSVEDESRHEAAKLIREIEESAKREGDSRARHILVDSIQRCTVDQTSETTVSVVPLPNDEMKGRIIGREGRNIRAFEALTGVDLIIDDTPEAVVLSCFDTVRREVARIALTNLIVDGRIHPGRIEELIGKAQMEVDSRISEAGERAILETGMTGIAPELVILLGKLKYRTSYGQNVLNHSVEVSLLCGLLAAEVGADAWVTRRAGLLHDIGKGADFDKEGPHALISGELLRRHREPEAIAHAAEAHHHDVEPVSLEALLVICADQISASRPGARREALETYVKRVRKLEEIGDSFPGVEKTFAVQAGREIRMIVQPEQIDDLGAIKLARDMARRIEEEVEYPGQIKITVLREMRAVDYAR